MPHEMRRYVIALASRIYGNDEILFGPTQVEFHGFPRARE